MISAFFKSLGQLGDREYEETVYTHYKAEPYWL